MSMERLYETYRNSLIFDRSYWPKTEDVADVADDVSSTDDLMGYLACFSRRLGFDYVSYTIGTSAVTFGRKTDPRVYSNYPNEWTDHYRGGNYVGVDPIILFSKRARLPFLWGLEQDLACMPKHTKAIMDECAPLGIRRGIAIPMHGPCNEFMLFSVCTGGTQGDLAKLFQQNFNLLWLLSPMIHAVARSKLEPEPCLAEVELTIHECECLWWTAQGKTSWEVSQIVSRSRATIEYHLQKAMRKLEATTKAQAVAQALSKGLL